MKPPGAAWTMAKAVASAVRGKVSAIQRVLIETVQFSMKWSEAHERVQARDARMCAYAMPQVAEHGRNACASISNLEP